MKVLSISNQTQLQSIKIFYVAIMISFAVIGCGPEINQNTKHDPNFSKAIIPVLKNEGGYANDPHDTGGETKFGISKKSYPHIDIPYLDIKTAKDIYYQDYWKPSCAHAIKDLPLSTKVLDLSVNIGKNRTHRLLRKSLKKMNEEFDETTSFNSHTCRMLNQYQPDILLNTLKQESIDFYLNLAQKKPTQRKFLRNWLKRAYS